MQVSTFMDGDYLPPHAWRNNSGSIFFLDLCILPDNLVTDLEVKGVFSSLNVTVFGEKNGA